MTATDFTPSSFGVCRVVLEESKEENVVGREGRKCFEYETQYKPSYFTIDCCWDEIPSNQ
jgi:hypothetical protein